jgi:hypothetical protein
MTDEIDLLRKKAAEPIERAAHRDTPLSPEADAEIMAMLKEAMDLEIRDRRKRRRTRRATKN